MNSVSIVITYVDVDASPQGAQRRFLSSHAENASSSSASAGLNSTVERRVGLSYDESILHIGVIGFGSWTASIHIYQWIPCVHPALCRSPCSESGAGGAVRPAAAAARSAAVQKDLRCC